MCCSVTSRIVKFQHEVFTGKHEFHDDSAWEFVKEHL
jgi:hypothetical protein